ncbi:MAG: hypothetical protein ACFCUR_18385 [Rhodomicrobiaceae bacterium]
MGLRKSIRAFILCQAVAVFGWAAEPRAQCYPGLPCPDGMQPEAEAEKPSEETRTRRSLWMHNGSLVALAAEGAKRQIVYEQARAGIRAYGAERGTLLFEGTARGPSYSGTAYIFTRDCGPLPYDVRGVASNASRRITLRGQAPSRVGENCQITSYRDDVLVFDFERLE